MTPLYRYMVIHRTAMTKTPDYYGPFVSEHTALTFAASLKDGHTAVRSIKTPAQNITTRPTPQAA